MKRSLLLVLALQFSLPAHAGWVADTRHFFFELFFMSADQRWLVQTRWQMAENGSDRPAYILFRPGDPLRWAATNAHYWYIPGNKYFAAASAYFPELVAELADDYARRGVQFPEREDLLVYWHPVAIRAARQHEREEDAARLAKERQTRAAPRPPAPPAPAPAPPPPADDGATTESWFWRWLFEPAPAPAPGVFTPGGGSSGGGGSTGSW